MKALWEQIKLDDLFVLQMGKTPAREREDFWRNGNNKWVSIADIGRFSRYTGDTKEKITDQAVSESGIRQVPQNTLIMSFKLSIGKVAITREPLYTNEAIMAFIDRGERPLYLPFLFHLFRSKDWSAGTNKAVLGMTLNKATLKEISIPVPALSEQENISGKLDKICYLISLREQQLQKLNQLASSRFIEMFGRFPENEKKWPERTIRDVVSEVCYGSSRPASKGGQYPYLRMNNITYTGELDLTDVKTIDIPENELSKCSVRRGDVLFNRTNSKELVGKTCVYDRDELMVLAGFVIRIRLNKELMLPEFLSAFLNTDFSKQMLLNLCKTAIGQANINAQELQDIGIYLPPIDVQQTFVAFEKQLDKSKVVCERECFLLEKCTGNCILTEGVIKDEQIRDNTEII